MDTIEAGRKGGNARRDSMTAEQRSEAARRAVNTRWKRAAYVAKKKSKKGAKRA